MSGLLYRFPNSLLDLICHVLFMLTRLYILCKIFLSLDMRAAVDLSVSFQVSPPERTAGRIVVLYIFVLLFPDIYLALRMLPSV